MNIISAVLLMAAGAMIGYPFALLMIKKVGPGLDAEMLNRTMKGGDPDA